MFFFIRTVLFCFSAVLLASAGSAFAAGPVDLMSTYQKRAAVFSEWRGDLRKLQAQMPKELSGINDVESLLSQGTIVVPFPDGSIRNPGKNPASAQPPYILVLFPENQEIGPVWKNMYGNATKGGSGIAANFFPEYNALVLRATDISPLARGTLLAHEGYHAFFFSQNKKVKQTDEEYCDEEAVATAFEVSVLSASSTTFAEAVKRATVKHAGKMFDANGNIHFTLSIDKKETKSVFGPERSHLDANYQGTVYRNAVLLSALYDRYKDDSDRALGHLSEFLCSQYKRAGIR